MREGCSGRRFHLLHGGRIRCRDFARRQRIRRSEARLSIARALIRRPEIYVFDDSFSALDFKTDANLRAAREETTEATVLIVAQRVSTVMDADRIIVLDEGRIAGIGTHEELMASSDVYREIVTSRCQRRRSHE